ncbi:MAG: Rne/Rng family ribonuclease [Acidobacteriota bacterium]|nr:Rne/Rng family ribonuclease [Acidobacteriota bacterium]
MKKQVLVSVDRGETRVALLEGAGETSARKSTTTAGSRRRKRPANPAAGYDVAELYLERRGARSIVGNIYKGRVDNVLPGLEAAFVDIGLDKNGFLHVDEIVLPGVEAPRRGRGSGREAAQIGDLLKPGQEIVVQVVKDPLKTKGARLSMDLTIAGRYMVYAPYGEGVGVSRRLDDRERDRLRKEAAKLDLKNSGAIIRTAAQGAKRPDLERELQYLFKLNDVLQKRVADTEAPALVFQEADLSVRVVRDIYSGEFERAIVDDEKQLHRLVSFFSRTAPELVDQVELWTEERPLFESFGVDKVLDSTLSRRVDLPSGGYLVIDYAEALTVIDVNSGSFTGKGKSARLEDTITKTNLEAADEVVRQLRLRDIGGIIVIDFIDMARARNRDAVLKTLRKALDEDRTKTFVVEISPLGLVEMTRQNVTEGVREIMTRPCPTCHGEGVIKSEETIAIEFERRMRELATHVEAEALLIQMNPRVSQEFTGHDARVLRAIEADTGKWFHFEGSEGLPLEHFAVLMEADREQVLERALPFREGEEVYLEIIEPHMYSAGDAVAKVDGYIISVKGGDDSVGLKRLVRIEEVGRTEAKAVPIDQPPAKRVEPKAKPKPKAEPEKPAAPRRRAAAKPAAAAAKLAQDVGVPADPTPDELDAAETAAAEIAEGGEAAAPEPRSTRGRARSRKPAKPDAEQGDDAAAEHGDGAAAKHGDDAAAEPAAAADPDGAAKVSGAGTADEAAGTGADGVESPVRRRGRRGGRRRSAAKAGSAVSVDESSSE